MKHQVMKCRFQWFLGLALALVLVGCGTLGGGLGASGTGATGSTNTVVNPTPDGWDKIEAGSTISVTFTGVNQPPPKFEGRVNDDGTIALAYIGSVTVAGKTRADLEREITDRYVPRYYGRLTVSILSESRYFTVLGQVNRQGVLSYLSNTTVLKAIAGAGGFTDYAKRTKVELTRASGKKFIVNCIKAQDHPELDLPVLPGDKIFVPRRFLFN